MIPKYIVANWKMNGSRTLIDAFVPELVGGLPAGVAQGDTRVAVCPPSPYLGALQEALAGSPVATGAQNVHPQPNGAFTGEVSAAMLGELGVSVCIVGHSERRQIFGESDAFIREKLEALQAASIEPILCVGETLEEREAGRHESVVDGQVRAALTGRDTPGQLAIAYEPVWAIGTGKTASPEQANAMHQAIRGILESLFGANGAGTVPILYGGSVNGGNAADLLSRPQIDGALVGGASLKAESFLDIIQNANR